MHWTMRRWVTKKLDTLYCNDLTVLVANSIESESFAVKLDVIDRGNDSVTFAINRKQRVECVEDDLGCHTITLVDGFSRRTWVGTNPDTSLVDALNAALVWKFQLGNPYIQFPGHEHVFDRLEIPPPTVSEVKKVKVLWRAHQRKKKSGASGMGAGGILGL